MTFNASLNYVLINTYPLSLNTLVWHISYNWLIAWSLLHLTVVCTVIKCLMIVTAREVSLKSITTKKSFLSCVFELYLDFSIASWSGNAILISWITIGTNQIPLIVHEIKAAVSHCVVTIMQLCNFSLHTMHFSSQRLFARLEAC